MSLTPNGSPVEAAGTEHIDGLYSYALVLTRNRSEAEDLLQETYVRALGAMGRLRTGSKREELVIYHPAEHLVQSVAATARRKTRCNGWRGERYGYCRDWKRSL